MFPDPLAVQVPPPAPTHVHVPVSADGNVSATVAPDAFDGPALEVVIVYVTLPPGVADVTPSVFVIAKSADGFSVSVSVAELLPGVGSLTPAGAVTVAVFDRLPVALGLIVALTVYVTDPPAGRLTVPLMFPDPLAVQVPPPAPTHVHVPVSAAANVSATIASGAFDGPALEAVIVYVTLPPGVADVTPSVFEIAKSASGAALASAAQNVWAPTTIRSAARAHPQRDLRDDILARDYSNDRNRDGWIHE